MPHSLVCWRCGASLAALSLPLRRLDVCKACNAELHVCKMCVEYDTSYAKHCKEPTAEEVRKKDEANFCDFFKPKAGAYVAKDTAGLALGGLPAVQAQSIQTQGFPHTRVRDTRRISWVYNLGGGVS